MKQLAKHMWRIVREEYPQEGSESMGRDGPWHTGPDSVECWSVNHRPDSGLDSAV